MTGDQLTQWEQQLRLLAQQAPEPGATGWAAVAGRLQAMPSPLAVYRRMLAHTVAAALVLGLCSIAMLRPPAATAYQRSTFEPEPLTSPIVSPMFIPKIKHLMASVGIAAALYAQQLQAQNVGVNTATPDPSAVLDVFSNEKGFLPPRLTTAQRDAIASPTNGLMIYNLDTRCMEYWNTQQWISMCSTTPPCTPPTLLSATATSPVCLGESVSFNAVAPGATTYYWSGPDGFTAFVANPSIATMTAPKYGTYYVTAFLGSCASNPMPVTVAQQTPVLTDNLVAHYKLDGTLTDESSYANTLTNNGATLTTDRYGTANRAYSFDGVNDYMEAPNHAGINITGSLTLSAWIRIGSRASWESWLSKVNSANNGSQYRLGFGTNASTEWGMTYRNGAWSDVWTTNSPPPTGSWVHTAMVVNTSNNTVKYYLNGALVATIAHTFGTVASTNPLWLGRQMDNNIYFDGAIDDVRIYNTALKDCAIGAIYDAERP